MDCETEDKERHSGVFHKYLNKGILHKLFWCPSFWQLRRAFHCPECGKKYRCYYDGNDVTGHGIDLCNRCAKKYEGERT